MSEAQRDSLKRFLAMIFGAAITVANAKFGLGMDDTSVASLAILITGYIVQSGLKSAAKEKAAAAAATVTNLQQAAEVLSQVPAAEVTVTKTEIKKPVPL